MIRAFATHPTAANLLMLALLIIGLASVSNLKRETFPGIPPNQIEVRVEYPGATAEEVEESICQRIEDAVDKVNDVEETRCEARENIGIAVVEMRDGVNFDRFLSCKGSSPLGVLRLYSTEYESTGYSG